MGNPYTCDLCGIVLSKFFNLKRHLKNKHGVEISNVAKLNTKENGSSTSNSLLKTLKCCICDVQGTKRELDLHYIEFHEIDLDIEKLEFISVGNFHEWKAAIENENHCKYIASCGRKKNHERYMCHRSGEYKSKGKGLRSLKKQGSKKIGAYCPSKIIVTKKGTLCSVKFVKTHVGHENELCHVTLPAAVRAKIANRLSQKVPPIVLLEEVKNSMRETNDRIHLLNLKDIYNISKEFKIDIKGSLDSHGEINLEKLSDALKCSNFENPILYYKPLGETDKCYPELQVDDFILITMNQIQIELLRRFINNTLILDRTWKISYNLHLLMLVVLDKDHQAFPCCFFFTNKDDESRLKILFTILKLKFGTLKTNILMTCVMEQYFKAWTIVMGDPEYHVYCSWSVNQAWATNLNKIKNHEKHREVTETLKTLSEELDAAKFPILLNQAVQKITRDEETCQYGQYFCKFYLQKVVKWARCYQMQLGLTDTDDLEKVCKIVKCIYFNFKKRGDLNDCILFLYRYLRDRFFDKRVAFSEKEVFRQKKRLKENHVISVSKNYSNALNESGSWIVMSATEKTVNEIKKLNTNCRCEIFCDECNICAHHYTCTCTDSSVDWNMCDHIHYFCTNLHRAKDESTTVVNSTLSLVKGSPIDYNDCDNNGFEKSYFSDGEDYYEDDDDLISKDILNDQSEINAVLEINGLLDEIILNMDSPEASTFVVDNLKKMLDVLKARDINSLRKIVID